MWSIESGRCQAQIKAIEELKITIFMNKVIRNETGKAIGYAMKNGNSTLYTDAGGKAVSRVSANRTYTAAGAFRGFGDQGIRLLTEKKSR
jgi:hypothetical protein